MDCGDTDPFSLPPKTPSGRRASRSRRAAAKLGVAAAGSLTLALASGSAAATLSEPTGAALADNSPTARIAQIRDRVRQLEQAGVSHESLVAVGIRHGQGAQKWQGQQWQDWGNRW